MTATHPIDNIVRFRLDECRIIECHIGSSDLRWKSHTL